MQYSSIPNMTIDSQYSIYNTTVQTTLIMSIVQIVQQHVDDFSYLLLNSYKHVGPQQRRQKIIVEIMKILLKRATSITSIIRNSL